MASQPGSSSPPIPGPAPGPSSPTASPVPRTCAPRWTIGAPADPEHVLRHIEASAEKIERDGRAEVHIGGRPFTVRKQFLDDLRSQHVRGGREPRRRTPLHALTPGRDRGHRQCGPPLRHGSIVGADHGEGDRRGRVAPARGISSRSCDAPKPSGTARRSWTLPDPPRDGPAP